MPKRTPRGRLQFEHQEEAVSQDGQVRAAAGHVTSTKHAADSSFADAAMTHGAVHISHPYTCRQLTGDESSVVLQSVFQALDGGVRAEGINKDGITEQSPEATPRAGQHTNSSTSQSLDKSRPPSGPSPQLHLVPLLEVECFSDDRDASLPYYERQAQDVLAFFDDYLPHDPVHIVKLGQSFRLSIHLSGDACLGSALLRIVSVFVTPPDAEGQSLDITQWREKDSVSAFAYLDPTQFASAKLNAISPYFGLVDRKYVKLSVCTTVLLGNGRVREAVLHDTLYFKVVHVRDRMRFHKFLGMFVTKEEKRRRQKRALH